MLISAHEDIDTEMSADFSADFNQGYEHCEELLIQLESTPSDQELIHDLFRSIHTIKGNLSFIGLKELTPLLQAVEDILDLMRSGQFYYDDLLSDLILLSLDKTKSLIDENLYGIASGISAEHFANICHNLAQVATVERRQRQQTMHAALRGLDPNTEIATPELIPPQLQSETEQFLQFLSSQGIPASDDIRFISQLTPAIEERSSFWSGHSFRMTKLCLQINAEGGSLVDPAQLAMGSLMHDISMAFLPMAMLHKEQPYSAAEKRQMHSHVRLSHDLLSKMSQWEEAEEIVLQHHERCDGSGYPKGLTREEICPGAKILAIADTFDACCYARAYKTEQKRPLVRAILEINRHSGGQFDEHWVEVFNRVVKKEFVTN